MRFASFFAGAGGIDLGFQRAGLKPVFHCEIDQYCQKILKRHWPEVPLHGDINTLDHTEVPNSEIWSAGWPCQDVSHANSQRAGIGGARSGLFYKFAELVEESKPKWLVLENVIGLLSSDKGTAFEGVIDRLEEIGYLGVWFTCNLLDTGRPQNRKRVFIIASHRSESAYEFYSNGGELLRNYKEGEKTRARRKVRPAFSEESFSDAPALVQRRGGFGFTKATSYCPTIRAQTGGHQGGHTDRPILCGSKFDVERMRNSDGIPRGMDGRRGRLIGNAVAPNIAQFIGERILQIEMSNRLKLAS